MTRLLALLILAAPASAVERVSDAVAGVNGQAITPASVNMTGVLTVASYTFTGGTVGSENYMTVTNPNNSTGFILRPRRSDGNQMITLMLSPDGNIAYNPASLTDTIPNGIKVSSRPFTLDGTNATALTTVGNVGIGTTAPAEKLDVVGVIKSSSTDQIATWYFTPDFGLTLAPTHAANSQGSPAFTLRATDSGGGNETYSVEVDPEGTGSVKYNRINGSVIQEERLTGTIFTNTVTVSSSVFVGLSVSSVAIGGAGSAVTALCLQSGLTGRSYATGGGCDCSSIVAATSTISRPNCVTAGCVPSGWTCQVAGGTGGQCIAYAMCSRLQ